MPSTLVIGATRGLGAALVKQYASQSATEVYGTTRSSSSPQGFPESVKWLSNIDLTKSDVGESITQQLKGAQPLDVVVSGNILLRKLIVVSSINQPCIGHQRGLFRAGGLLSGEGSELGRGGEDVYHVFYRPRLHRPQTFTRRSVEIRFQDHLGVKRGGKHHPAT